MLALIGILFIIFLIILVINIIGSIEASTWIAIGIGIVVIVVLTILIKYLIAFLKKPAPCQCCGKELKGIDQQQWGWGTPNSFIICKACTEKVHPQIVPYAKEHWSYKDFADYLAWEEETKVQRSQFVITDKYGTEKMLMVDAIHGLFCIGKAKLLKSGEKGLIFRFEDLADYDINFKPEEVKEGVLGSKVRGTEYAMINMNRPVVAMEESLNSAAEYSLRVKGFINTKYEYDMSEAFLKVIAAFTICVGMVEAKRNGTASANNQNFDEIQKALALFMFDSMADVTEQNLKQQRNALIKAFHPDSGENNEAYSQKINAAYDLLKSMIKN